MAYLPDLFLPEPSPFLAGLSNGLGQEEVNMGTLGTGDRETEADGIGEDDGRDMGYVEHGRDGKRKRTRRNYAEYAGFKHR